MIHYLALIISLLYNCTFIYYFIGTQAEFKAFWEYYTVLIGALRDQENDLYRCITSYGRIVNFLYIMGMDCSNIELLLAIIAMELYSDNIHPFYEMLKFMEGLKQNVQCLTAGIQQEVSTFDQDVSPGMYVSK